LTDQSGPGLTERPHKEQAPADATDRRSKTPGEPRQGWGRIDRLRLLTWAGMAFGIPGVLIFLVHLAGGGSGSAFTVRNELPVKAVMVFFVLLATWIVSRIEKRSLDEYGIPLAQAFGWRFWEGTGWGFAMLSAILLALRVLGDFQIDSVALAGGAIVQWALAWGLTFLGVSLSEELAFRGYWLFSMARRMRFWPAALFLSAVFGLAHLGNKGENVLGVVQVVATGLLFCLMIRRTGNLWFAIGFHAAWDWAETFLYGTPDSGLLGAGRFLNSSVQGPNWLTGGSAGPEGSVFAFFALALCALLVHLRFPKAIYPDRPV
jgi:membrane protease YdiL (CAAX protease family)